MKKKIFLLNFVLIMMTPIFVMAQPGGEGWTSLKNQLQENSYELRTMEGSASSHWNKEIVPSSKLISVSKLAFKKNAKEFLPNSVLHLKKIKDINGVNIVYDNQEIEISNGFDIKRGNEKIKSKQLPKTEDGWIIYDIEDPAVILSVTNINNENNWNSAILQNIYLYLDPEKDPRIKLAEGAKEAKKIEEEKRLAATFTNPKDKGWTSVRTDKLDDGITVDHYAEGVRTYTKPNGDFASFIEPEDKRDEKLNLIKGMDQELVIDGKYDGDGAHAIGDYRITYGNGIVMHKTGNIEEIIIPNGSKLISAENKRKSELDRSFYKGLKSDLYFYQPTLDISLKLFLDPDVNFLTGNKMRHDQAFDEWLYNKENKTPIFSMTNGEGTDAANQYLMIYYETPHDTKLHDAIWLFASINSPQLYSIDEKGLTPIGIYLKAYEDEIIPILLPMELERMENDTYYFKNKGDYIKEVRNPALGMGSSFREGHLTLGDGTVIERFPDNDNFKVTRPNSDIFIGEIDPFFFAYQLEKGDGQAHYKRGKLTTSKGKEYEYSNGINVTEEKAQREKLAAELLKKLYAKYGKATVDAALSGNIKTGMNIQMLKDIGHPLKLDEQGSYYSWYKMVTDITYHGDVKYKWIRVNNKTGNIDYIGSQRTGGFMSY